MSKSYLAWVFGLLCLGFGTTFVGSAHSPQAAAPQDDLLTEVRAIRSELKQVAGSSIRAQLLVARLQMQEQRINILSGRLAEVRRSLSSHRPGQETMSRQLQQFERGVQLGTTPADEQRGVDGSIRELRRLVAEGEQEEKELQAQEAELTGQLATEQSRWAEINNRLDDLERQLPTR
jgi:chromosome segregation ATPase